MSKFGFNFLDSKLFSRNLRLWKQAARRADTTELPVLRQQRNRARQLRQQLDRLIYVAEDRLARPRLGSDNFPKPHNTDWAWRPELWRGPLAAPGLSSVRSKSVLGSEVTLFHDCTLSELSLKQLRNLREADLAPYGLRLDVFQFNGSFLSLVVDLPNAAVTGLKRTHIIRLDTIVEMEKPLEIFVRLNVKHGPNTEQIVRELQLDAQDHRVEFDLAYTNLNEKRIEAAWIDIIFENPEMNEVILRDLTFSRRPRATL